MILRSKRLPMVPIGSFKISQFKHEQTRFGPPSLLIPICISGEKKEEPNTGRYITIFVNQSHKTQL